MAIYKSDPLQICQNIWAQPDASGKLRSRELRQSASPTVACHSVVFCIFTKRQWWLMGQKAGRSRTRAHYKWRQNQREAEAAFSSFVSILPLAEFQESNTETKEEETDRQ